jgi:hypothetical protein
MEVPKRMAEAIETHDGLGKDVHGRARPLLSVRGLPKCFQKKSIRYFVDLAVESNFGRMESKQIIGLLKMARKPAPPA